MGAPSSGHPPLAARRAGLRAAAIAAAVLALCLSACLTEDKHAGVDEFPNSIYARVNGFLDESKKSGEVGVPALGDSLQAGAGFIVGAAKAAAPKAAAGAAVPPAGFPFPPLAALPAPAGAALAKAGAAAGCSGIVATWTDSLAKPAPTKLYTKDTLQVCLDAKALDTIKGNETLVHAKSVTVYGSGRIETAEISDGDGDGILNPVAGGKSRADLILTALENGVLERTALSVGPGPDNDFSTEADNLTYSASWTRTRGADTLARAAYADADSDGVAVDNGKASVVDLDLYQKGPSDDHPDALWTRALLRLVVRYRVEAKEARRVRFEMEDQAHRLSVGEILSRDGARDFSMRDTVIAHFTTVGAAASDSLDTLDVRLTMGLGADFDSKADDSVYALRAVSTQKRGDETKAEFSFLSSRPMASGAVPEDGTVAMAIEYRDGTALKVEGTLKAKALDVVVTDRAGKRAHVKWDAEGRGVLYERLP
jgi:hypothetical protein